jgi:hypothetical protein
MTDVQDTVPISGQSQVIVGMYCGRSQRGRQYPFAYQVTLRENGGISSIMNPQYVASGIARPGSSPRLEAYRVFSTVACGVYGIQVNTTNTPGWVMLFDLPYPPPDGELLELPVKWWQLPQNYTLNVQFDIPCEMSSGATLVFSTEGPVNKQASPTAVFSGESTVAPRTWVPNLDYRKSHNSMFLV